MGAYETPVLDQARRPRYIKYKRAGEAGLVTRRFALRESLNITMDARSCSEESSAGIRSVRINASLPLKNRLPKDRFSLSIASDIITIR